MTKRRKPLFLIILYSFSALCLTAFAILFIINQTIPKTSLQPEILSENQLTLLKEADHLISSVGNRVFPGWSENSTGWVVYNESTAFAVGIQEPTTEGWIMYPRNSQRGGKWQSREYEGIIIYQTGILDPEKTPENFIVKIGDQIAASFQTHEYALIYFHNLMYAELPPVIREVFPYKIFFHHLTLAPEAYVSTLSHEAFHVFQAKQNPTMFEKAELIANWENQYPFEDETLLTTWKEELKILQQAAEISNREDAIRIAEEFLRIREQRRHEAKLSESLIDYERKREWLEGMAKYAELEIGKIAAESDYQPLPQANEKLGLKNYNSRKQFWKTQLTSMANTKMDGETLFYYSGFAQGVLLDHLMPGWKERVIQGENLEDLISETIKN